MRIQSCSQGTDCAKAPSSARSRSQIMTGIHPTARAEYMRERIPEFVWMA